MRAIHAQTGGLGLDPRILTGHYGTLQQQRQTSIEDHNASVRHRPLPEPYPSNFARNFFFFFFKVQTPWNSQMIYK